MKKKRQSESDVFRERWFVVKDGVLSYYRDKKVRPATHNVITKSQDSLTIVYTKNVGVCESVHVTVSL